MERAKFGWKDCKWFDGMTGLPRFVADVVDVTIEAVSADADEGSGVAVASGAMDSPLHCRGAGIGLASSST
jgi:hypothetical protein